MSDNIYGAEVVDLFAGPGGWSVALRALGITEAGIEWDKAACQTRRANGLPTIEGDVREYGPNDFPFARGLIASPPCQTFSAAGKGAGRRALDVVLSLADQMARREPIDFERFDDERTALVLEPLRWALEAVDLGAPFDWLAFEQVPTVLPVWEHFAEILRVEGYSVETAALQAEQYGVPQTRKRAILVARFEDEVAMPTPTHSRYYSRSPQKLDEGLPKWVSMAEALSFGLSERPSPTITGGGTETGGAEPIAKLARYTSREDWVLRSGKQTNATVRPVTAPAPTVTGGHDSNDRVWLSSPSGPVVRSTDHPAGTVTGAANHYAFTLEEWRRRNPGRDLPEWAHNRPSTTIVGSFKPEVVAAPGYRTTVSRQNAEGSVRVSVEEAAILQSFPPDFVWEGSRTKQYQQVGNAVPPLLALAVIEAARP